jgi:hypothetical protein
MYHPFNARWALTSLCQWGKYMAWVLSSLIFRFQCLHNFNEMRMQCSFENITLCNMLHTYMCHQQRGLGRPLGFGGIIYIEIVQGNGQGKTLWYPCLYFPGHRHLTFNQNYKLFIGKKYANRLDHTSQKFQFE